jgi:uncharacterized membrane protein
MAKLLSLIFLSLALLSAESYAVSFGTVAKNDISMIAKNESAKFTLLFWNVDNDSYIVKLEPEVFPKDWTVIIEPNDFALNSSSGKEMISLPYMKEGVRATPVYVIAKPPQNVKFGTYEFLVSASTYPQGGEIELSQQRIFNLSVRVGDQIYKNIIKDNQSISFQNITSFVEDIGKEIGPNYYYAAIILIILLVSFLIYRYS